MHSPRPFFRLTLLLAGGWLYATACGGRTETDSSTSGNTGGTDNTTGGMTTGGNTTGTTTGGTGTTTGGTTTGGNTTGGTGGTVTSGGTGGTFVTTGAGGASFAGAAGQIGIGGSGGVRICNGNGLCPNLACGPGTQAALPPNGCCPVCQPCNVACPAIGCGMGSHPETPPGQCCPTCVPDPISCASGQMMYEGNRAQLYDKYSSTSCQKDADCGIAPEINRCVARCGVPLPVANIGSWTGNLTSFANTDCAACPPMAPPPCVYQMARCVMSRCTTGLPGATPQ